jgi:hypothetical protein
MRISAVLSLVLASIFLASCTMYTLVKPQPRTVAGRYQVDPQIEWSRRKVGTAELWTVHGPQIEVVYLTHGIGEGETLFKQAPGSKKEPPVFRADLSPSEVAEFTIDSLTHEGYERVELADLRPEPFGGKPGFRFELSLVTKDGLEMGALAAGSVVAEELYLVLFMAPRLHYYETYLPHVEKLVASVEFR